MWSLLVFLGCLFLAYLITAAVFIGLGTAVLLQWPKPHIFCFTQPFSDAPSDLACFGLNKLHFVFAVVWAGLVVAFSVRLRVALIIICSVMAVAHLLLAVVLRHKVLTSPLFTGYPPPQADADLDAVAVGFPVQMPPASSWPPSQGPPTVASMTPGGAWPPATAVPSVPILASGVPSIGTAHAIPSMAVAIPVYPVPSTHIARHAPSSAGPATRAMQPQPGSAPL